jgi:hypothetical protein
MSAPHTKRDDATWEKKNTALEAAFRNLQIKQFEKATGIPYKFLIPGMGRELMLMSPIPRPKTIGAKKALDNLTQSTGLIIKVLDSLPQTVLDALNFQPAALRELKTKLRILHVVAKQADVNARSGAPKKAQPSKIALVVARHYYGLTGKKPTVPKKDGIAYGPFLELLKAVYGILDIKASAASQAEKISRNWTAIASESADAGYGI